MLEKLLTEIQKGNTTSPVILAERLGLSTTMVQAMLATLEDQGYLKSINLECNSEKPCETCPVSHLCTSNSAEQPRIRMMTQKEDYNKQ
jgi:DNA-binding Lrp family transcriptional regulator